MAKASNRDANAALQQRFAQAYEQYSKMRGGMADLQQKLSGFAATKKSADGLIRVTVDARGRLVKVDLHPSCFREYSAQALGAEITRVTARATEAAGRAVTELMAEFMPEGSSALKFMRTGDLTSMMSRQDDTMNYRAQT